ncbi:MAG: hypothetical protein QM492_12475 [Rhodobacterales bacterium]
MALHLQKNVAASSQIDEYAFTSRHAFDIRRMIKRAAVAEW